jgi:hypothetical protein
MDAGSPAAHPVSVNEANPSGEKADESAISARELEDEEGEGTVRKRRGIRLKQDLN